MKQSMPQERTYARKRYILILVPSSIQSFTQLIINHRRLFPSMTLARELAHQQTAAETDRQREGARREVDEMQGRRRRREGERADREVKRGRTGPQATKTTAPQPLPNNTKRKLQGS
jgi:hypothetical protein